MKLAQLARQHGAGRFALDDKIDPLVGAIIDAPVGQTVRKNDPLLTFYHNRALSDDELLHAEIAGQRFRSTTGSLASIARGD